MKLGILARGEQRGLGNLTFDVWRALRPDRTLLVEMGTLARGFPIVHDYGDALRLPFVDGRLDEEQVRDWLTGLDVLYSAETFYDWRIVEWAAEAGVATVLHSMPEFNLHHGDHGPHRPTEFWNPTRWRQEHMPDGTRVVPVPVALDRFTSPTTCTSDGPLRVLHTAGHRAAHDRNGTTTVLMAARRIREPVILTLTGQDGRLPTTTTPKHVDLRLSPHSQPDYWSVYEGHDVLVLPRRFGGLCLPVNEAMAAGLAVVMPDCEPNMDWPVIGLHAQPHGTIRTGAGDIDMHTVNPGALATLIDELARDREQVHAAQTRSRAWAEAHSWDALRETWLTELESAALAGRATRR